MLAPSFSSTFPVTAMQSKPHQPQNTELGFTSKDRCAHPLTVLRPPTLLSLIHLPYLRIWSRRSCPHPSLEGKVASSHIKADSRRWQL